MFAMGRAKTALVPLVKFFGLRGKKRISEVVEEIRRKVNFFIPNTISLLLLSLLLFFFSPVD